MIYHYQELTIKSELKIIELHEMKVCEAVNQHTSAALSGIYEPDERQAVTGGKLTIADGENGVIFTGKIHRLEDHRMGRLSRFELSACSFSKRLDWNKRTRVIQNQDRTYRELLAFVTEPYPAFFAGGTCLDSKFPPLVVQNQETDWKFIKRLAAQMGENLSVNSASEQVQFFIGSTGETAELTGIHNWKKTYEPESEKELLHIKMRKRYHPGCRLQFQGRWYSVKSCECRLIQSEILYHLQLEQETVRQEASQSCPVPEGLWLSAYVKEVKRNHLRLQFENEAFSSAGQLPWFPYSGEVNNEVCFAMSPKDVRVEVLCTDLYGTYAIVTGAARHSLKPDMAKRVTDKVMENEQENGFILENEEVRIQAGSPVRMELSADGDIVLQAQQICLEAKNNFMMGSFHKSIHIEAERNLCIASGKDGCGQIRFDEEGNIRCKSVTGLRYKSSILTDKSRGMKKKTEKGMKESVMAMAGAEFLAQSVSGKETDKTENYIKTNIFDNDERMFCAFSYGENKNGG